MGRRQKQPPPSTPSSWPNDSPVIYLNSPLYSPKLSKEQAQAIKSPPTSGCPIESPSHVTPARIQLITNTGHPANGQRGLYCVRDLAPDTFICFYLGYVHNDLDNNPNSDYDLSMNRDMGLAIDATKMGNEARFVNDYRGVPGREFKGPNADFRDCWIKGVGTMYEKRVGIYVLPAGRSGKRKDGVKSGEEILVSYGKGFWCRTRDGDVEKDEDRT